MRTEPRLVLPPRHAYVMIQLPWLPEPEGFRYAFVPRADPGDEGETCEREASHPTLRAIDLREGTSLALVDALLTEWARRADDEPYPSACPYEEGLEGGWAAYVCARIPEGAPHDLPPRISPADFGSAFRAWVRDVVGAMFGDDTAPDGEGVRE